MRVLVYHRLQFTSKLSGKSSSLDSLYFWRSVSSLLSSWSFSFNFVCKLSQTKLKLKLGTQDEWNGEHEDGSAWFGLFEREFSIGTFKDGLWKKFIEHKRIFRPEELFSSPHLDRQHNKLELSGKRKFAKSSSASSLQFEIKLD